jgi:hypothetical protein
VNQSTPVAIVTFTDGSTALTTTTRLKFVQSIWKP